MRLKASPALKGLNTIHKVHVCQLHVIAVGYCRARIKIQSMHLKARAQANDLSLFSLRLSHCLHE